MTMLREAYGPEGAPWVRAALPTQPISSKTLLSDSFSLLFSQNPPLWAPTHPPGPIGSSVRRKVAEASPRGFTSRRPALEPRKAEGKEDPPETELGTRGIFPSLF